MKESKEPTKTKWREYGESLLIAVIIALIVRSFFLQAFKIPSSSMEPTLLIGDHLLVNRLSYVAKVPFADTVLFHLGDPVRGDVVVFRWPKDRSKDFIKRVIATEGETVEIKNKAIFVNGKHIQDLWGVFQDTNILQGYIPRKDNFGPVKVPKDSIFVMGDNRDRSDDSRFWGFVHRDDLVGKALIIYFSWDRNASNPIEYLRWTRFGRLIR